MSYYTQAQRNGQQWAQPKPYYVTPKKPKKERATHGMRAACKYCGQDIEFHGFRAWVDRGGNRACVTYFDRATGEYVKPKTRHARP